MNKIKILMDLKPLLSEEYTNKGIAKIWIRIDEVDFPESNWSDFALIILSEWAYELIDLLSGKQKYVVLKFVDGSYAIHLEILKKNICRCCFGEWNWKEEIVSPMFEKKIDISELKIELERSMIEIKKFAIHHNLQSQYLNSVVVWLNKLQNLPQ